MTKVNFKKRKSSIKNLRKAQKKTFLEADRRFKETERVIKESTLETERVIKETFLEADKRFKETERAIKETERAIKEISLEADRRFKETERAIKESDLKTAQCLRELEGQFTGRWGKLIESLVSGDLIKLLKGWNIEVDRIYERDRGMWQNKQYEFDIVASNGSDIVVTEVKTTMKVKDVKHFLDQVKDFRCMHSDSKNKNIYGAMAYLHVEEAADVYAEHQGLFIIRATGSSASIINKKVFKPKNF